jgi:hypothetical protein
VFETYRMLGEQREAELLHKAQRLQAGQGVRHDRILGTPRRPFRSVFCDRAVAVLMRPRRSTTPAAANTDLSSRSRHPARGST